MIFEEKGYLFVHLCEMFIQAGAHRLHAAEVFGGRQASTPKAVRRRPTAVAHIAKLHPAGAVAVLEQCFSDIDMPMHRVHRYRFRAPIAQGMHGAPERIEQALGIAFEIRGLTCRRARESEALARSPR